MKVYKKKNVILSNSLYSIFNELNFYKIHNNKSNFFENLHCAFQDSNSFYLVQHHTGGCSLRSFMTQIEFTEKKAKFIIACLILSLEYLHNIGYIYRDLNPDTIFINDNGYTLLTNFKCIREFTRINHSDVSGTPGYLAPEIISRQNYSFHSDFFSLGVIAYELMFDKTPYTCNTGEEYVQALLKEEILIRRDDELPDDWSIVAADFVNRCLMKNCENRLGYNGIHQLKQHKWFEDFDWDNLAKMKIKAPFIPDKNRNNFSKIKENEGKKCSKTIKEHIQRLEFQGVFESYFYDSKCERKESVKNENNFENLCKFIERELKELCDN